MTIDLQFSTGWVALWLLHVCRASGLMIMAPILGGRNVPVRVRISLVVVISTILFMARPDELPEGLSFEPYLVLLISRELLVGLFLGLLLRTMFVPFLLAGEMISHEMAFAMSRVVDPEGGTSLPILGVIFEFFALMIFLAMNLHHKILELLAMSLDASPPGFDTTLPNWIGWYLIYFVIVLKSALILVAPVFLLLLVITLGVGLMSKTVPQMNALDFSFPSRILGAMAALYMFFPDMGSLIEKLLLKNTSNVFSFLSEM